MITYKLQITSLECIPSLDQLTNVVERVYWSYTATQDDGQTHTLTGTTQVPIVDREKFIAYEQLTSEVVEGWVNQLTDLKSYQAGMEAQLNQPIQQPNVMLPLLN
jgi:hypothetical protein